MSAPARLAFAFVAALLAIGATPRPARADDDDKPELQRMRFVERDDVLALDTRIEKLFDEAAYQALASGFPSTVVIATAVYPSDGGDPVAAARSVRTAVYDLWDEVYTVQIDGKKPIKVKYQSEALKLLSTIDDLPIAKLTDIPIDDVFFLRLTAQLNPVSKATLAEVRRWLSHGSGGGLERGGVFFGSFVSVFVNPKIAEADRVLRLRSQPFFRPKS